jgi:hypothetical protein
MVIPERILDKAELVLKQADLAMQEVILERELWRSRKDYILRS